MNSDQFSSPEIARNLPECRGGNPVASYRERRASERTPTEQHARLQCGIIAYKIAIEDFSSGGCRVVLRQGLMPTIGTAAEIFFTSGIKHSGVVVWQSGIRFGFHFETQQDDVSELLFPEQRGSDFFRDLMRLQNGS